MGCWNKTCGLSNLPITSGTEVYVFVLEQSKITSDRCYTTALWSPLLLPFESVYDDYGGGEQSGGVAFDHIMQGISKSLVELPVGENEYHDIAVKCKGFGEKQFFESVHEGRLNITNSRNESTVVDFVMLRKDIVHGILKNRVIKEYVGENKGTCGWGNSYIEYGFEDIIKDIPSFIDRVLELPLDRSWCRLSAAADRSICKVSQYIGYDSYRYSRLVETDMLIIDLLKNGKRKEAEELLTENIKSKFIDSFMDDVRKVWIPGCHEGSQSQEYDSYTLLIDVMQIAIAADKSEFEDEE